MGWRRERRVGGGAAEAVKGGGGGGRKLREESERSVLGFAKARSNDSIGVEIGAVKGEGASRREEGWEARKEV